MDTNSSKLHRRSIRLKGYDYASEGVYFVTLVTAHRQHLFGEIVNGVMHLNTFGRIAREEWYKTQRLRPNVELDEDEFVVMPNHVHGILWLHEDSLVRAHCSVPLQMTYMMDMGWTTCRLPLQGIKTKLPCQKKSIQELALKKTMRKFALSL